MNSFATVSVGDSCRGRLVLCVEISVLTYSEVPDERDVREEEGEAAVDDARDIDLSGLAGFFLCLFGEGGEISFGESVGVPL